MIVLPLVLLIIGSTHAQTTLEKDILAIVDRFFAAMAEHDTLVLDSIMTAEGIFHSVVPGKPPRATTHAQFISDIGKAEV